MENKIKYVKGIDGALNLREFCGYGQRLSILKGKDRLIVHVFPEDEKLGVVISNLEFSEEDVKFRAPRTEIQNAATVIQNIRDAIAFCKEFREREAEFKNASDIFPEKLPENTAN